MKVLQINTVYGEGSTGKIAKDIHDICFSRGINCLCACRSIRPDFADCEGAIAISSDPDSRVHGILSRYTMLKGEFSRLKTAFFLKKAEHYSPDLIHIHNLHGSYVNLPLLFKYIKSKDIPVIWTLHDCWPFTGICSYFLAVHCKKWEDGCGRCPQRKSLCSCPFDLSHHVWKRKRKWFTGIKNAVIVTPSEWLASLAKKSFLGEYDVRVINNGIDLTVFKPTESDFRKKNRLENKHIVLGTAFAWDYRKGLDVIINLAASLPAEYQIVLVGTNDEVDKMLPPNILSIHRTSDQRGLAEIYTAADVFINPTREDNFPTVNIEAIACGTPVITFRTGGSAEMLDDTCGVAVEKDDVGAMREEIIRICTQKPFDSVSCVKRGSMYDRNRKLWEYIDLYADILSAHGK